MAGRRDYTHAGRERPSPKGGGLWLGLLFGVGVGLAIAGVLIWYFWSKPSGFREFESAPSLEAPARVTPAPVVEAPPEPPAQPPAPEYTFYDILAGEKAPKPIEPQPVREIWWLQVAALREAAAAEELKARLALINLESVVQRIEVGGVVMHRVRVGPFASEAAAHKARDQLLQNKFEPRLLKEPVNP